MKKIIAISFAVTFLFSGCLRKIPWFSPPDASPPPEQPPAQESPAVTPDEPEAPGSESSVPEAPPGKAATPDGAAEVFLESVSNLDKDTINELVGQYFSGQTVPEEYINLLEPISARVAYKIGETAIDGDKAAVQVAINSVDAQSAINSIMPGAVAHLAVMQLTGKDVSNPQKILADYAADNIKWDDIPRIDTNSTLYLVKGADGEWKTDATNPENLKFANAITGGAIDVANSLKSFADRYK